MSEDELVPYDLTGQPEHAVEVPPGWKFRNLIPRDGEPEISAWLRQRIAERLYLAQNVIKLGNAEVWTERSSGVLMTGEPTEDDPWYGTQPMGDSSLTRLMEANDPRDTIARCDAELAILDEHGPCGSRGQWCVQCGDTGQVDFPCDTVLHLASAYRYRPGYREEWKP